MKKIYISAIIFLALFSGCSTTNKSIKTPEEQIKTNKQIFKSKILSKYSNNISKTNDYQIPYIKESKYIKILILPFLNNEGDVDYGGILETKLEDSKFIFDKKIKNKIIKDNDMIGSI